LFRSWHSASSNSTRQQLHQQQLQSTQLTQAEGSTFSAAAGTAINTARTCQSRTKELAMQACNSTSAAAAVQQQYQQAQ
jgi:hypothetical protein